MVDIALAAVRSFVTGKLKDLHADFLARAAEAGLPGPDASWSVQAFDLDEPDNDKRPQKEWLLLLKNSYHNDALSEKHRICFSNTDARLLACPDSGPMEIGKFFATNLGGKENAAHMTSTSDLDAEAIFSIIKTCSFFDEDIRITASKASKARNDCCHRKAILMDEPMARSIHDNLRSFLLKVPGCEAAVEALDTAYNSAVRCVEKSELQRYFGVCDMREIHRRYCRQPDDNRPWQLAVAFTHLHKTPCGGHRPMPPLSISMPASE